MLGFHPYFDIWHNKNGIGVSSMHWLLLHPTEIPQFSFFIEAEWTPALVSGNRRKKSLLGIKSGASCLVAQCLQPIATLLGYYKLLSSSKCNFFSLLLHLLRSKYSYQYPNLTHHQSTMFLSCETSCITTTRLLNLQFSLFNLYSFSWENVFKTPVFVYLINF